jgi:type VI secretion system secreted protein VgrG
MHVFEEDPPLTVANQYNETDYNHLHRRWETRGMHYWYEHRFDGHKLMLSDKSFHNEPIDATSYDDVDVIAFHDKSGSLEDDGIHQWSASRRLGSGTTTLASVDYKNPGAQHATGYSANRQGDIVAYEVYEDSGAYGAWWSRTRIRKRSMPPAMPAASSRGAPSNSAGISAPSRAQWTTTPNRAAASVTAAT